MARLNINNIENVEGKYHLMFFEGKNIVEQAKSDIRYAWFSLLFFLTLILVFVVVSGFNLFYVGFLAIFFFFFLFTYIYLIRQKKKGTKQCIYAVQNSKTTDIVAKQLDTRKAGKVIMKSMSSTIDKYDVKEKFPKFTQKWKRKRKHNHIVDIINQFEEGNKTKEV